MKRAKPTEVIFAELELQRRFNQASERLRRTLTIRSIKMRELTHELAQKEQTKIVWEAHEKGIAIWQHQSGSASVYPGTFNLKP